MNTQIMSFQEKITEEIKVAMKAKDRLKVDTLRMVHAQFKDAQIAKGDALTEDEELVVLTNAAKKRKEAIAMYEKSERTDLMEKERKELDIISFYLPKQLSQEEVMPIIEDIITQVGATGQQDLGKVMGAAMKQLKGRADGKLIQELVRQKLS